MLLMCFHYGLFLWEAIFKNIANLHGIGQNPLLSVKILFLGILSILLLTGWQITANILALLLLHSSDLSLDLQTHLNTIVLVDILKFWIHSVLS